MKTTGETNGELLRFEYVVPPRWSVPEHVHPRQEERHEVLSGTLWGRVGEREQTFGEGRRVIEMRSDEWMDFDQAAAYLRRTPKAFEKVVAKGETPSTTSPSAESSSRAKS